MSGSKSLKAALKSALKRCTPAPLWAGLRALRQRFGVPEWRVDAQGFERPDAAAEAWDRPALAKKLAERIREYDRRLQAGDGMALNPDDPSGGPDPAALSLAQDYATVFTRAAEGKARLRLLDWGGGPGAAYALAKHCLPQVQLSYTCQELETVCDAGRELFPEARFLHEAGRCFEERYDLVIAGSSLWYAHDWRALAGQMAASAEPWLFIAKTGFVDAVPAFVAVQRPTLAGYERDFPCWILNRPELIAHLGSQGLELVHSFEPGPLLPVRGAAEAVVLRSLLFKKKGS